MDGGRAWFLARSKPIGFSLGPPLSNSKNIEPPRCASAIPMHFKLSIRRSAVKQPRESTKRSSAEELAEAQRSIRQHLEYTPIGLLARMANLQSRPESTVLFTEPEWDDSKEEDRQEDLEKKYGSEDAHRSYFLDSWIEEERTATEDDTLVVEDLVVLRSQVRRDPIRLLKTRDNCPQANRLLQSANRMNRSNPDRARRPSSAMERQRDLSYTDSPSRPKSAQANAAISPNRKHELHFSPYSEPHSRPLSASSNGGKARNRQNVKQAPSVFSQLRPMSASAGRPNSPHRDSPARPMSANAIYEEHGRNRRDLYLSPRTQLFVQSPKQAASAPVTPSSHERKEQLTLQHRRYDNCGRASRGHCTEDLVRLLLNETNGWGASHARGAQTSFSDSKQSSWTLHRRAYTLLPQLLRQQHDWARLDHLIADPHFLVRCLAVGGMSVLLSNLSLSVRALLLADPAEVKDFLAPSQALDRMKQVRLFLDEHREVLQAQPSMLFQLAAQDDGRGAWPLVTAGAAKCVDEAREMVTSASQLLAKDDSQSPEYYIDLFLCLRMLLDNGCVACMNESGATAFHSLFHRVCGQLSALRKLGFKDFISLFGTKTLEVWLDLLDADEESRAAEYRTFVELNCKMQEVTSADGREGLREIIVRDSAAALAVAEENLVVTDVTMTGATLLSRVPLDIRKAEGVPEDGPVVCFNHRPCQWECLTVYVTSTIAHSEVLLRLLHSSVFPSLRRLCFRRAVDLDWVILEEGGLENLEDEAQQSIRDWVGGPAGSSVRRNIFLLLLLPSSSNVACTVERHDSLFFLSSARSDQERVAEEAAMLLSDCLWSAIADKYPMPTATECTFESELQLHLLDMERMARTQILFASRAPLIKSMLTWIRSEQPRPLSKRLYGAEGSGRSYLLAALAHRVVQEGQFHVIYFRCSRRHSSDDLVAHLCAALSTGKERSPSVERAGHLLAAVAAQQQVVLFLDGLAPKDESHVQQLLSRKPVAVLQGGVRCVFTSAHGRAPEDKDGSWVVPQLSTAERWELFQAHTESISVPFPEKAKQALLSKKHSGRPQYLVAAARIVSMMSALLNWHVEERDGEEEAASEEQSEESSGREELLVKLAEHMPAELSSLLEESVVTLLERQHGQGLVRRSLEYLFHCAGGLSVFELTTMIQRHADLSAASVHAFCSDLAPFLGCLSADLQLEHGAFMLAVARRYFEDYKMDSREARSLVEKSALARQAAREAAAEEEALRRVQSEAGVSEDEMAGSQPSAPNRASSLMSLKNAIRLLPSASSASGESKLGHLQLLEQEGLSNLAWSQAQTHPGGVLCMTSFPVDSAAAILCTGGSDGTIKVWDAFMQVQGAAERLRQLRELRGALDSDVEELTTKGDPRALNAFMRKFWLDPHVLVALKAHTGAVMALLAHDNVLYSGSVDTHIRVWDRRTWRTTRVLKGHRNAVTALCVGGGRLYSASHDGRVLMWDLQSGERMGTLDATSRAYINSIVMSGKLLLSATERRWNEDMNTVKVWSADVLKMVDQLPSHEMQGLARDIKTGEEEEEEAMKDVKHMSHRFTKLRSPIKRKELQEQIRLTKQNATATNLRVAALRQQVESMQGGVFHEDDIYCMHVVADGGEDGPDLLFSGGLGPKIIVWDLQRMVCLDVLEDLAGDQAEARSKTEQYTKCIVSDHLHLYSGGGWVRAGHSVDMPNTPEGCVRVWNLAQRKLVGTISLRVPVLSLAVAGEALVVGDVNGGVSLFVRGERVESFTAKMESQIKIASEMEDTLKSEFSARRAALHAADSQPKNREQMQLAKGDCSLLACLLFKLSNQMAIGNQWESPEGEIAGVNVVLKTIARYPHHPILQIAALEAMSHLLSSPQVADRVLSSKSFLHVANVVGRMSEYAPVQQAVCLLLWELAAMDGMPAGRNQKPSNSHARTRRLIENGAITTLLAAIDDHPTDLQLLNVAVPLLRLLVVREPADCKLQLEARFAADDGGVVRTASGKEVPQPPRSKRPLTDILDTLEHNIDEIRIAASQPGASMQVRQVAQAADVLRADLVAIQGVLQLRLNGKPVQQPQATVDEQSALHPNFFYANTDKVQVRRAKDETWKAMRSRTEMEWAAGMQRQQLGEPAAPQAVGWMAINRTPS